MTEPKFQIYSWARCVSGRPEHAPIHGRRVAVLDRREHDDGKWIYTVTTERKADATFTCAENELEAAEPRNDFANARLADTRPYAQIRRMLRKYLCEDWDLMFNSIEEAIQTVVGESDVVELIAQLSALKAESDSVVKDVLDDHDISIWNTWTPRGFLSLITEFAIERQSAIQNADAERDASADT